MTDTTSTLPLTIPQTEHSVIKHWQNAVEAETSLSCEPDTLTTNWRGVVLDPGDMSGYEGPEKATMNILITEMPSGSAHTQEIPETISSVSDYINELANNLVDEAVTEDCALDKLPSDYMVTQDGPLKARVFRDGDLALVISAQ